MNINLVSIDPNTYKQSLKNYLKTQTVFKDYDFEDSNMAVLIELLARNTYLNTFYKNMIYNESNIDTALLRSSIISKAKELGYVPQSRKSSVSTVSIRIDAENISSLEIPKGTQFTGKNGLDTYSFVTDRSYIAKSATGNFMFNDVLIYQGSYQADTYTVNSQIEKQNFIISNKDVDISSIEVNILESDGVIVTNYKRVDSAFGLDSTSEIYFVEGYDSEQYSIQFGQNIIGKYPENGATVIITYRVASGIDAADGISEYSLDEDIVSLQGGILNTITITTTVPSVGGGDRENIESIRYNAPRYYSVQESAVTAESYRSLVLKKYSTLIQDVNVFGGEFSYPKQYGKVIISLKPRGSDFTPQYLKDEIFAYLTNYNVGTIDPIIIDADNYYITVNSIVQFNSAISSSISSDIRTMVENKITDYSAKELEKFGGDFRYSKFASAIDSADKSITSNDTTVQLVKRIKPLVNTSQKFYFNFNNELNTPSSLSSTEFSWIDMFGNKTMNCFIQDSNDGYINIAKLDNEGKTVTVEKKIGTINYQTGAINISNLTVDDYINYIQIKASIKTKDIIMSESSILTIEPQDITISIIETVK